MDFILAKIIHKKLEKLSPTAMRDWKVRDLEYWDNGRISFKDTLKHLQFIVSINTEDRLNIRYIRRHGKHKIVEEEYFEDVPDDKVIEIINTKIIENKDRYYKINIKGIEDDE